jgi:hypothetical protein
MGAHACKHLSVSLQTDCCAGGKSMAQRPDATQLGIGVPIGGA